MATTGPSSVSLGLLDGDRVVANLEGPITERAEVFAQRSRWSYRAAPAAADALAHAGVTAAGLANNHAMDRGPEGLTDTLEALAAASIASTGAGDSAATAATPLLLATSQGTVAVVALGDHYGGQRIAENGNAGGASYHPCAIVNAANEARAAGADIVAAFVHWGPITATSNRPSESSRGCSWMLAMTS